MSRRTDDDGARIPYVVRFVFSALALIAATLVLVLIILPQRYVLSSGFAESGISFPTAGAPFQTVSAVRETPPPPPPPVDTASTEAVPAPGPAELFWSRVRPLVEAERYPEALELFEDYLADYPGDRDVRREYAVVLFWADRPEDAVRVLENLLGREDEAELRLLLARTLRDLDRPADADRHYRWLWDRETSVDRALEWSRSWSWSEEYDEAIEVVRTALEAYPASPGLRVELARLFYFTDRLAEAEALLLAMDAAEREEAGGESLLEEVAAALAVPEAEPTPEGPPPSLLEQARTARAEGELDTAEELFRLALEAEPGDPEIWQAWADFLQYERDDVPGARDALLRVEALGNDTVELQYRLAQLEIWSGETEAAERRLETLVDRVEAAPAADSLARSDVLALLGDLGRWDGRRAAAAVRYRTALTLDPAHPGAREGLEALEADEARVIGELERPGAGIHVSTLSDTDDYRLIRIGGSWVGVSGVWVWRAETGNRWLEGVDLTGTGGDRSGFFGQGEVARWWRTGTIRTGIFLGADAAGAGGTDLTLGASLLLIPSRGGSVEVRYLRGPAYPLTATLQSAIAGYEQDRVTASVTHPLNRNWTLSGELGAAHLRATELEGTDATTRLSAGASLGRRMSRELLLGLDVRGLGFTEAAPVLGGRPLFWDPAGMVSVGPFARWERGLGGPWSLRSRLGGGVALLNERRTDGWTTSPQLNGELGLGFDGPSIRSSLDLFYLQGQFEGWRAWGLRFQLSTPAFGPGTGGAP